MDLRELKLEDVDWTHLTCDTYIPEAASCEHSNEPSDSIKDGEFLD
jgi:hypothetical protein